MVQPLTLFLHIVVGVIGAYLVFSALLLTETEEGKLHTFLHTWWNRIRDLQAASISQETAFVKVVTDLTSKLFSWLFGGSFWVVPAAPASVAYSTAAFVLSQAFIVPFVTHAPSLLSKPLSVILALVLIILGSIGPFIQRLERPSLYLLCWCGYVLVIAVSILSSFMFSPSGHFVLATRHYLEQLPIRTQLLPFGVILLSMASDFVFVTFTRKGLLWASTTLSFIRIVAFALTNFILGATLFVAPFVALRLTSTERVKSVLVLLGSSNLINLFVAIIWFLLATLMLVHRVVWPLLWRPIHSLERHKIITDHRKMVLFAGIALLCLAWPSLGHTIKNIVNAVHAEGEEKEGAHAERPRP